MSHAKHTFNAVIHETVCERTSLGEQKIKQLTFPIAESLETNAPFPRQSKRFDQQIKNVRQHIQMMLSSFCKKNRENAWKLSKQELIF